MIWQSAAQVIAGTAATTVPAAAAGQVTDPWMYVAGAVVSALTTIAVAWITKSTSKGRRKAAAPAAWPPPSEPAVGAGRGT